VPATSPSRLEVLKDARKLAESVGVVENGDNFFETQNGERRDVRPWELSDGIVEPERVCGVCIAGACALAELLLSGGEVAVDEWLDDSQMAARDVLGDERFEYVDDELTRAIDDKGLPYVLAVLDRMVEREQERS
jgi:hypothetical protein